MAELTEYHAAHLVDHAVDLDLARAAGVCSIVELEDRAVLGEPWETFRTLPAIAFPWTAPDGRVEWQLRPDNPTTDQRGRPRKYMFRPGMTPLLWAVRPVEGSERMLIVEGTKQGLAAASYAPDGVAVYAIAGCRNWQDGGVQLPDLFTAEDREVVVILDADAASNLEVYRAGEKLAAALDLAGASKVAFTHLPAAGKSGLDDVLGSFPEDKRAGWLARAIERAKAKPADKAPPAKKKEGPNKPPEAVGDRKTVVVNADQFEVINDISAAMTARFSGERLFCHGGVLSELISREGHASRLEPVDKDRFGDVLQQAVQTVREVSGRDGSTSYVNAWPERPVMGAVLRRAENFAPLSRLATAPFVRENGSVVSQPGYDLESHTLLVPDTELAGVEVPEDPTPEQIEAARDLILVDWLGDFPFESRADRANALALILTPAIRGLVKVVPLAVVDGSRMGVGKGKIAETLLTVYTGGSVRLMNMPENDELRKQITSAFRAGTEFFAFDEAHVIEGAALAQALTASMWEDRILGVSRMGTFPNNATWISLGNNVQVKGDLLRRVYRISIRPGHDDPENRPASSFRHPNLERWVQDNRRALLTAVLTLVRGWFAAGRPEMIRPATFQSFTEWEQIIGGILEHAGVAGFLENRGQWSQGSDPEKEWWAGHLLWLSAQFGDDVGFTIQEVVSRAKADIRGFQGPPGLLDPMDKEFPAKLPYAYRSQRGRPEAGLVLDKPGKAHNNVGSWVIRPESKFATDSAPVLGGDGGDGGDDSNQRVCSERHSVPATPTHVGVPPRNGGGGMTPIAPIAPIADWDEDALLAEVVEEP